MKIIFSALTLVLAFTAFTTAHAADKKLGTVILVERTVDNVYKTCAPQIKNDISNLAASPIPEPQFFSCRLEPTLHKTDFTPQYQRLLTFNDGACSVEGAVQNTAILITLQLKGKTVGDLAAKNCLQRALNNSDSKDSFTFTIFTIE